MKKEYINGLLKRAKLVEQSNRPESIHGEYVYCRKCNHQYRIKGKEKKMVSVELDL